MKKMLVALGVVAMLAGAGWMTTVDAQTPGDADFKSGPNERAAPGPRTRSVAPRPTGMARGANAEALGTIVYDDGVVTAAPSISSYMFGNQFDSANGNPLTASGSVTQLSFFIVSGAGGDNVFVSLYDQVNGTTANFIEDISVPLNNGSSAFNTANIGPYPYVGNSFLAGVWYVAGDTVGLGAGTVNGQGHHGIAINDITGTDFQTLAGVNALVGASGNVLIPVELMGLTVE